MIVFETRQSEIEDERTLRQRTLLQLLNVTRQTTTLHTAAIVLELYCSQNRRISLTLSFTVRILLDTRWQGLVDTLSCVLWFMIFTGCVS